MQLSGVMVALATPVGDDGQLDHAALEALVHRVVAGGVHGISPVGTTGEGASLSLDDRLAIVDTVRRCAPDGMPIVPGIFAETVAGAVAEIEAYAGHGAAAALVAPPHYYVLGGEELLRFFAKLAAGSSLPLVIYQIPSFTKNPVPPVVVAELAANPQVVGLKDSSRDMEYLLGVIDALAWARSDPDGFSIMTGTDTMLLAALGAGARGAIVASANLVPELAVGILESWREGKVDDAGTLERRLRRVVDACRMGNFPAGWKAALAAVGVCGPGLVPPRLALPSDDQKVMAARLAGMGIELAS